ncbi:hypothetical protein FRC12_013000 [Ceratobasidium sp. 428]|nr:hypothetical protein FRC12_013000 [Ceratobasidium sp. 428]
MQSHAHDRNQQLAPPPVNLEHNLYHVGQPTDASNIAISQSTSVVHNSGLYPQSGIPTDTPPHSSVPNWEAPVLNQTPPTPITDSGNQTPLSQPWARLMPEQVQLSPAPALQYQAHRRWRSSHTLQEYIQNMRDTQTSTDLMDLDQLEQSPEQLEAIRYQRELENYFVKRLWLDGEEINRRWVKNQVAVRKD